MDYITLAINKKKGIIESCNCDIFALMAYSWLCIYDLFDSK